jgi:quercetin dioxygenase-like cupin family protein
MRHDAPSGDRAVAVLAECLAGLDAEVQRAVAGDEVGAVALVRVGSGGGYAAHRHRSYETVVTVVSGTGLYVDGDRSMPFCESDVLYVPAGASHGFYNAGTDAACLLMACWGTDCADAPTRTSASSPGSASRFGPRCRPVSWHALPSVDLGAAEGFVDVRSTLVVTADTAGSQRLLAGVACFAPGGAHTLHRHRTAGEALYVMDGDACWHLGPDSPAARAPAGSLTTVMAGEWHGLVNRGPTEATVIFFYLGAASVSADGYELAPH